MMVHRLRYWSNKKPTIDPMLMLGQRRRRWTNIKTTLVQRLVFAGEGRVYRKEQLSETTVLYALFDNLLDMIQGP